MVDLHEHISTLNQNFWLLQIVVIAAVGKMNTSVLVLFVGLLCYASAASFIPSTNPQLVETPKGTTPCVTPKQWEGRFSEWDHNKDANNRYKISFDGVKRRKYVEEEMKSMIPGRR